MDKSVLGATPRRRRYDSRLSSTGSNDVEKPYLSQRIVSVDSYICPPVPGFDQCVNDFNETENHWVPVIRIFGPSTKGQKCCAHIHGVFPYLYIPALDNTTVNDIADAIDNALNKGGTRGNERSRNQLRHVVKITQVRGRAYYGFQSSEDEFLKVYFYTPYAVTKAAQLLANGSIFGLKLQPHEAHIPFVLQFFMDYNLFGMNLINFRKVLFRGEGSNDSLGVGQMSATVILDGAEVDASLVQTEENFRTTRCELEFDVHADDVLNALEKRTRNSNPGIAAIWQDEMARRLQKGLPPTPEIVASGDRTFETLIFDNERMHLDKLQRKLVPVTKNPRPHVEQRDHLDLPESSQRHSFVPIGSQSDTFSFSSQNLDDESVINMLMDMAKEANEQEEILSQKSILTSFEPAEIMETEVRELEGEKATDDEQWHESFVSQVFEQMPAEESDDEIHSSNPSGAARTEPVNIKPKHIREDRRLWHEQAYLMGLFENTSHGNGTGEAGSKIVSSGTDMPDAPGIHNAPAKDLPTENVVARRAPEAMEISHLQQAEPNSSQTSVTAVQTEPVELKTVGTSTETETHVTRNVGMQTDDNTYDVLRTCGCKCDCGRQYMSSSLKQLSLAECRKDRGSHSTEATTGLTLETLKRSACTGDINSSLLAKIPRIDAEKLPRKSCLSPVKRNFSENQKRFSPLRSPVKSQSNRNQLDAVKQIKNKAIKALSRQNHRSPESMEQSTDVQTSGNLDLSITSVYEYEDARSPRFRLIENQARSSGLRVFTYQQQHRKRRRERKEQNTAFISKLFPDCAVVTPGKRTPHQNFIASLVAQDEAKALPAVPDYYAENKSEDLQKQKTNKSEVVIKFGGGNLSDSEDDSQITMAQSSPQVVTQVKSKSTPKSRTGSGEVCTPKSILKTRNSQRRRTPKTIRWGIQKQENGSRKSSNETVHSKTSSTSTIYNPNHSELDGPTINPFDGNVDFDNLRNAKAFHTNQFLTLMCMEVFCKKSGKARGDTDEQERFDDFKLPDPEFDEIIGIFYEVREDKSQEITSELVMYAVQPKEKAKLAIHEVAGYPDLITQYFDSELEMVTQFLKTVLVHDPDILIGFEVTRNSWGYLLERGRTLNVPISTQISRILPKKAPQNVKTDDASHWDESVPGRIVLNLWKLLRHEITVQSYTFESAMFHILQEKVGKLTNATLNHLWNSSIEQFRTVNFFCSRVRGCMRIIDKLDLVNRTSELARLFGIQFFEVFSRGSQFRVESMMLRLAKSANLIPPSPTVLQRAHMRAPMELPLIMEPISQLYNDPVAVLDFQSLYPSIMIAYNYDFSTCLGRVEHLGREDAFPFGCLDFQISPYEVKALLDADKITVSPTGVVFVKENVQRGLLPEMLNQILDTRIMVKKAMKEVKNEDKALYKVLDSRQLGLKLIANVTYGYTSANFSGRMPCVEIADSIVAKGRETLERAIQHVNDNFSRWGADVVYGDTDSMFIRFKNCSRSVAFQRAQEIVDEVTQLNPKPVKLKLEKVYQPCILQTKKRYVGFSYETPNQTEPIYDAKGIETVRRDGCPAVAKILRKGLTILFTSQDKLKLRQYIESQFQKIMLGNVNLSDYTFAREFRGRSGYKPGAVVPALAIADRLRAIDRRAEPLSQERVPYLVIYGSPGQTLIHQTRTPREFIEHEDLRINATYYIERVIIPALNRCFSLAGINVQEWYKQLPRRYSRMVCYDTRGQQGVLEPFLTRKNCIGCDQKAEELLCTKCVADPDVYLKLTSKADAISRKLAKLPITCKYCYLGICVSLDCHTWQKLARYDRTHLRELENLHKALELFDS